MGANFIEATGNLHIGDVIVTCSKLALGQLIQIQVMDSASDKILKFYIYNKSSLDINNRLNKNLKMHCFIYL